MLARKTDTFAFCAGCANMLEKPVLEVTGIFCTLAFCATCAEGTMLLLQDTLKEIDERESDQEIPAENEDEEKDSFAPDADLIDSLGGIAYNICATARMYGHEEATRYAVTELQILIDELKNAKHYQKSHSMSRLS